MVVWNTMVLLPKGSKEYQEIRLVEVVWKVCATVVNCRLKGSVKLQDALHGFKAGRETGTAILK